MSIDARDERLLRRALELARAGIGLASPNPYVGAVITDALGNVVGEGTYAYAGVKHAEILALEAAGERARGGTLYINLEPHAHQGRTPPCTDALITAGIRRVVASMPDPNPKVGGRGFDQLRAAGVQVEIGALELEAKCLNEAFARYIRNGVPFVTLKSAMSLDGKIAPPTDQQKSGAENNAGFRGTWITGELARAHVQELRHEHDAILAGIGTVLADNPLLTDRSGRLRRRPLLRVILDSHLRLPINSHLVQSAATEPKNDLLVFCSSVAEKDSHLKRAQLEQVGVQVETVDADADARLDLQAVLRWLARQGIISLMIEGGSTVNGTALSACIVDKVFLYYAPTILGRSAVPFVAVTKPGHPVCLKQIQAHSFGADFAIEGYLRDPYAD